MTCKDCYYEHVCTIAHDSITQKGIHRKETCQFYKDKSRIVELPVSVGDKVYKITRNRVKECEVVFVGLSADEKCSYFNFVENYEDGTFYKSYSMPFDVIGKTVFLTPEKAEETLKKEQEK